MFRLTVFLFVIASVGCAVSNHLIVDSDYSGSFELDARTHPLFAAYLDDLELVVGPVFDVEAVSASLEAMEGVSQISVERDDRRMTLRFDFDNFFALTQTRQDVGIFAQEELRGVASFLTAFTSESLFSLMKTYTGPSLIAEYLFPDEDMHEEEYREHVVWAFESYGAAEEVYAMMDSFVITTRVTIDGEILLQEGGTLVAAEEARFEFRPTSLLDSAVLFFLRWQTR